MTGSETIKSRHLSLPVVRVYGRTTGQSSNRFRKWPKGKCGIDVKSMRATGAEQILLSNKHNNIEIDSLKKKSL